MIIKIIKIIMIITLFILKKESPGFKYKDGRRKPMCS